MTIILAFLSSLNFKLLEEITGHHHFMATTPVKITNHAFLFSVLISFGHSGAIIRVSIAYLL